MVARIADCTDGKRCIKKESLSSRSEASTSGFCCTNRWRNANEGDGHDSRVEEVEVEEVVEGMSASEAGRKGEERRLPHSANASGVAFAKRYVTNG